MPSYWSSKIIVFMDEQGQDYVSTTLPMGGVIPATQIRVYQARGPYMPTGYPKPELVGDAAAWMAALTKRGYTFELSTLD